MSAQGRFLPVATLLSDRQLLGESGHWDANSRSHIYDIRERQLRGRFRTFTNVCFRQEQSFVAVVAL